MTESPRHIAADDPEWCAGCSRKHSKCECGGACRCATLRPGDDCPAHPFDPTQYKPAPSAGQDIERLRDELLDWLHVNVCVHIDDTADSWGGPTCDDLRDALLDGPLRQLIDQRDEARAELRALVEAVGRGDHVLPPAYRRAVAYVRALDDLP